MTSDHRIDGRLALPPSASFIPPASVLPKGQVDAIVAAQTGDIPPSVDTFGLDAATIKACLDDATYRLIARRTPTIICLVL